MYTISELQEHGIPFVYTRDRMAAMTAMTDYGNFNLLILLCH